MITIASTVPAPPLGAGTAPSHEEYRDALAVLAAAAGEYTAEDRALAAAWVTEYEAANR